MLPAEYVWLEPVIIATLVVFVISWIGNTITFSNRFINAFLTALLFGLIFGALAYFGYGSVEMSVDTVPATDAPGSLGTSSGGGDFGGGTTN